MSCEAKVLYGLMLDRMSLSVKNRWFDSENRVYIIFTVEDVMDLINCKKQKAVKILAELDKETGIGLIEKKRLGLGKANIIYVRNFMLEEKDSVEYENNEFEEPETIENPQKYENQTSGILKIKPQEVRKSNFKEYQNQTSGSMKIKPQEVRKSNLKNFENQTSGSMKIELQEVRESNFKSFENQTSRGTDIELQEVRKSNSNNTDINNTDFNYTNPSINPKENPMERYERYKKFIRQNIEYEALCSQYDKDDIDEIVENILDVLLSKGKNINIGGVEIPLEVVKSRFMKLDYSHIQYVFECLERNTKKIVNIKKYLQTVLYNAPSTMSNYYRAEVNYDLYGSEHIK